MIILNRILVFFASLLIFLCSCFREEIVPNEAVGMYREKHVIYCFINETDTLSALVYKTLPVRDRIFDLEDSYERAASVKISNQAGDTIHLELSHPTYPLYKSPSSPLGIKPGGRYFLEVVTPNGQKLKSHVEIPPVKDRFEPARYIGKMYSSSHEGNVVLFEFTWKTISGKRNFIFTQEEYAYEAPGFERYYRVDDQYNTTRKGDNLLGVEYEGSESFWQPKPGKSIRYFYLFTVSDEVDKFNQYHELRENTHLGSGFENIVERFKGVLPHYTNIEGGYGLFGAYLVDTLAIDYSNLDMND